MKRFLNLTLGLLLGTSLSIYGQSTLDSDQPVAVKHALIGWSTAIDGQWALISSPQKDNGAALGIGEVSFMEYSDGRWALRQIVQPEGLPVLSNFGFSVDLQEETAVIGSMGDAETGRYTGVLHLYHLEGENWQHETALRSGNVKNEDRFGSSVDIHNNLIVTGAPMADGVEDKSGKAIIFEMVDGAWLETAQLYAEDGANGDFFGHEVQIIDENRIAVGAYNAMGSEAKAGAVFIFERDGEEWIQTTKLTAPSGKSEDIFGYSLAAYKGDSSFEEALLFIGAPGTDNTYGQTGSVFTFKKIDDVWAMVSNFTQEDPAENTHFGYSLSVNSLGDLFVGASRVHSEDRKETGKVYAYRFSMDDDAFSFNNNAELSMYSEQNFSHFGANISSSEEFVLVSSPYDDRNGLSNSGSIHFYGATATSNEETNTTLAKTFELFQNYPNPFNPSTVISYQIPVNTEVSLKVFDMLGREVSTLIDEPKSAGQYSVTFNAGNLSSGMYIYRLNAGSTVITKKLTLIK